MDCSIEERAYLVVRFRILELEEKLEEIEKLLKEENQILIDDFDNLEKEKGLLFKRIKRLKNKFNVDWED